jgi:hypothetical protein
VSLPSYYEQVWTHVRTIDNAFHALGAAGFLQQWGAKHRDGREPSAVEAKAIKTIEDRLHQLCEYAGVRSRQCAGLTDQVYALQEAARRDRETIKRLEAALYEQMTERVP